MGLSEQFNKNGYVLLKKLIPEPLCDLVVLTAMLSSSMNSLGDSDVVEGGSVDSYGSPHGDALLVMVKDTLEMHGFGDLLPTYSFFRTYEKGSLLKEHLDRPSCNTSVSVALSQNNWQFNCVGFNGEEVTLSLDKGDAVLYYGESILHSRKNPLEDELSHHIFLHYVPNTSEYQKYLFDGRDGLGLPAI